MAERTTIINKFGKMTGWNNITVNALGRDIEGITEIKYDDTLEMDNAYGAGAFPIGYEEKNYKATTEIMLYQEEVFALQRALVPGEFIQNIEAFDIMVEYTNKQGVIMKDRIRNCKFKNNGRELKNNEGKVLVKMELLVSHIEWNTI